MNDMAEQVQTAVAQQREAEARTNLAPIEASLADAINRRADAERNIDILHDDIDARERELRGLRAALAYQEKRFAAQTRKIIAARELVRAVQDEEIGI